eukprot:3221039-Pyramimonas_sp.AAC.1
MGIPSLVHAGYLVYARIGPLPRPCSGQTAVVGAPAFDIDDVRKAPFCSGCPPVDGQEFASKLWPEDRMPIPVGGQACASYPRNEGLLGMREV